VDEKHYSLHFKFCDVNKNTLPNNKLVDAYVLSFESLEQESGQIIMDYAQRYAH
jgi:hypothetical protein